MGYDKEGFLQAAKIELYSNGGWSLDLSRAVTDRAVFHLDNAYYIPHVEFSGMLTKTNLASNTAFRGFGGPQGMLVIEEIMDRIARRIGLPPEVVRAKNLYRGTRRDEHDPLRTGDRGQSNATRLARIERDERVRSAPRAIAANGTPSIRTENAALPSHR